MPKLLYYKILKFQPDNLEILQKNFDLVSLETPQDDTDEILADIEIAFAPLGFFYNKEKIDRMPKLKVIASNTTGEPHIDREYAESKGIKVLSLKYEQEFLKTITPTAEHTFGLILALIRRTPWAYQSVLGGVWDRRPFGGKAMLSRMSIGIAGLGRLGKLVAQYAKAFQMAKILYYDPFVEKSDIEGMEKVGSLEEMVGQSDIITIHIPAEKETYKIFNKELFDKFKQGSFLINTSRAELVDEKAMLEALESGRLAGAAIDVFDGEFEMNHDEFLRKSPLLAYAKTRDNLLITPHIGGSTIDAWRLTERRVIDKIFEVLGKSQN